MKGYGNALLYFIYIFLLFIRLSRQVNYCMKWRKQYGMELLSIRSSDIAFTMGAKGPLLEKAHNFQGSIKKY